MSNPITPLTPAQTATEKQAAASENFLVRDLVALDIAANTLTGGKPDETISTRLAIDAMDGHGISRFVGKVGSAALNIFQHDHGADAAAGDLERSQAEAKRVEGSGIVAPAK